MEQRRGGKAVDTWDIVAWWRGNRHELPAFAAVSRAVLTHSPNSCVPEAIFSILRDSFDSDQKNAYADYREYSLQKQYNVRFNQYTKFATDLRYKNSDTKHKSIHCNSWGNMWGNIWGGEY